MNTTPEFRDMDGTVLQYGDVVVITVTGLPIGKLVKGEVVDIGVDDLSQVKNYKCYILTDKDRIWSCTDVLGLEQLPFDEYSHNRKTIIKADVLKEFGSNV